MRALKMLLSINHFKLARLLVEFSLLGKGLVDASLQVAADNRLAIRTEGAA
jgi:hypothetical protein